MTPIEARGYLEWGAILGEDSSDQRLQESAAAAENMAISSGAMHQQLMMLGADDHDVHLRCHRRAAVEAKIEGNYQLAAAYDAAALDHFRAMQPAPAPVPAAPAAGQQPASFDTPPMPT